MYSQKIQFSLKQHQYMKAYYLILTNDIGDINWKMDYIISKKEGFSMFAKILLFNIGGNLDRWRLKCYGTSIFKAIAFFGKLITVLTLYDYDGVTT